MYVDEFIFFAVACGRRLGCNCKRAGCSGNAIKL